LRRTRLSTGSADGRTGVAGSNALDAVGMLTWRHTHTPRWEIELEAHTNSKDVQQTSRKRRTGPGTLCGRVHILASSPAGRDAPAAPADPSLWRGAHHATDGCSAASRLQAAARRQVVLPSQRCPRQSLPAGRTSPVCSPVTHRAHPEFSEVGGCSRGVTRWWRFQVATRPASHTRSPTSPCGGGTHPPRLCSAPRGAASGESSGVRSGEIAPWNRTHLGSGHEGGVRIWRGGTRTALDVLEAVQRAAHPIQQRLLVLTDLLNQLHYHLRCDTRAPRQPSCMASAHAAVREPPAISRLQATTATTVTIHRLGCHRSFTNSGIQIGIGTDAAFGGS
jgi:hypothetical protein